MEDISTNKQIDEKYKLIPEYLKIRGLMKQHIDSYNQFINHEMNKIMNSESNKVIKCDHNENWQFKWEKLRMERPSILTNGVERQLLPMECRTRDLSQAAPLYADFEQVKGNTKHRAKNQKIAYIPVMIGSSHCQLANTDFKQKQKLGECPQDPQGQFIVKGIERAIMMFEHSAKNRIIIDQDANKNITAKVTSHSIDKKTLTTVVFAKGVMWLKHNSFIEDIPISIYMKAIGVQHEQEILSFVGTSAKQIEEMKLTLLECITKGINNQFDALAFLASKLKTQEDLQKDSKKLSKQQEAKKVCENVVLSHIQKDKYGSFTSKARQMGLMVRKIIDAKHDPKIFVDKDQFGSKRIELSGSLISLLFEDSFKKLNSNVKKSVDSFQKNHSAVSNKEFDVKSHLGAEVITKAMQQAMSTGNWNLIRFKMNRSGITQVLNRMSQIACFGMLTRLNSDFDKSRKAAGPRLLQPSSWGMVCPTDTPEGESCGLVKNLAMTCHITVEQDDSQIVKLCNQLGVEDSNLLSGDEIFDKDTYLVQLNGTPIGVQRKPYKFLRNFRHLRRKNIVHYFINIQMDDSDMSIHIATDGGRLVRPLIIVDNQIPRLTQSHVHQLSIGIRNFEDLIVDGILEFLDVNEESNSLIALTEEKICKQTSHLEIDPITFLGVVSGLVPFPDHNQSPRNTQQCAMGKQAQGVIAYNQFLRTDTFLQPLVQCQKPMVRSRVLDFIHWDKVAAGNSQIVAIMSQSGYDIEDASIWNRSSFDRGFMRSLVQRSQKFALNNQDNGTRDLLQGPEFEGKGNRQVKRFHAIEKDGLPMVSSRVTKGDIICCKQEPIKKTERLDTRNSENYNPRFESQGKLTDCQIDRVYQCHNEQQNETLIKIMTRETRVPEQGDKFSSRHGQKGVVGLIVPQQNFPFNPVTGNSPDQIMNPHGFPSRMTVGKLMELQIGKSGLMDGSLKFGTPFGGDNIQDAADNLVLNGFNYEGKDILQNGITGEPLSYQVFMGPIFQQRLKHMVADKIHGRATGPRVMLTRQPMEGRAKDGGLRLGEMERDVLVCQGASNLIMERMLLSSDLYYCSICDQCGMLTDFKDFCRVCDEGKQIARVRIPYAFKLLTQELMAMNILVRFKTKDF